jgi:uncharacterized protein
MQIPDRYELNAGWSIPQSYGVDRLVLLPRDPHWLFSYWEITPGLEQRMEGMYPQWKQSRLTLRVHNLTRGTQKDLELPGTADSWYFQVDDADCVYRSEIGRLLPNGFFVVMMQSNEIRTPRDCLASAIDPLWKMFPFWQHRYHRRLAEGSLSSYAFQAGVSSWDMFMQENPGETGGEVH